MSEHEWNSQLVPIRVDLAIPRLEIVAAAPDWADQPEHWHNRHRTIWYYRLVLRHLTGHAYAIDLGCTGTNEDARAGAGAWSDKMQGMLPWRDGAHMRFDARLLGLPAFIVVEQRAEEIAWIAVDAYAKIIATPPTILAPPAPPAPAAPPAPPSLDTLIAAFQAAADALIDHVDRATPIGIPRARSLAASILSARLERRDIAAIAAARPPEPTD